MHDIWRALQWWEDWQLRILVLGSLGLQWFLLLAAPMRKFTIPRVCRTCIWLAYIASDALAIYALATLFNRHARASSNLQHSSSTLEVLWAPILLIHLGGQKEMTGYQIEDNEMWMRHTVTLVCQVAVALYAFCKSWPSSSDPKLLATAILLFIVGVASFSEKPFAFNRVKIKRLAVVSSSVNGTRKPSKWIHQINEYFLFEESFIGYLRGWCGKEGSMRNQRRQTAFTEAARVLMVLLDMPLVVSVNELVELKKAHHVEDLLPPLIVAEKTLPRLLNIAFAFIYTRAFLVVTPLYLIYHFLAVPILHIAALMLFAWSDKHPYKRVDVKITYIIICLTAALDVLAVFIRHLLYRIICMTRAAAVCETMPSYNLIEVALSEGDKSIWWIYKCASRIYRFYFTRPQHGELYEKVAQIVITDLVDARDRDLASYRIFDSTQDTNMRCIRRIAEEDSTDEPGGSSNSKRTTRNWALSKELQEHCGIQIRKSLCNVSFDRSVLLWHVATDLIHRLTDDATLVDDGGEEEEGEAKEGGEEGKGSGGEEKEQQEGQQQQHMRDRTLGLHRDCAVAISNYMVHLFNVNPEMLLTGSRHHLISEAVKEVENFRYLSKDKLSQKNIEFIMDMEPYKSVDEHFIQVPQITDACMLAKELMEMQEATRWMLMYRVWLGMLCYSASMCRGYLHAKSLGEGGEFLSFVWLMLALKGAKCLADKLQMPPED
uniref:Uncharacterized protein n=1 Tax=Avena sativa TaxID=4498 RepID=A0ACD5VD56_AVESA